MMQRMFCFRRVLAPLLAFAGACCLGFAAAAQTTIPAPEAKLQLPAYWFKLEADAATPRPLVIALHGCGGPLDAGGQLAANWKRYAGYFNAEQIHFLVIDSFTPRGQKSICEVQPAKRSITEEDRRADVFATMAWAAAQPGVDAKRIIVAGWSHGAQTVLSVADASATLVQNQTLKPLATVAFYPGCNRFVRQLRYQLQAPMLVMVGELDDWTFAAGCISLRDKVLANQPNARFDLTVYPDSYHGFDGLAPLRVRNGLGSTKSGTATVGGNPAARVASHAKLFEFVALQTGEPLRLSHEARQKVKPAVLP